MDIPLQITFRNMDRSDAVEDRVRELTAKLERFFDHITSCRVMIEALERRHRKGRMFHVRVELGVPGTEIVASRHPREKHAHEDLHVAIRDAFDAAQRQLEDYARRISGHTKAHGTPDHGRVTKLFPDQGYGFVTQPDGQEIYFHTNSVLNGGFAALKVGDEVRIVVAEGESAHGSQASTVQPVGKHHIVA